MKNIFLLLMLLKVSLMLDALFKLLCIKIFFTSHIHFEASFVSQYTVCIVNNSKKYCKYVYIKLKIVQMPILIIITETFTNNIRVPQFYPRLSPSARADRRLG